MVIGGTSLFGGIGSILGTVAGALLIGVLRNGLILLNVSSFVQQIIIGVIPGRGGRLRPVTRPGAGGADQGGADA